MQGDAGYQVAEKRRRNRDIKVTSHVVTRVGRGKALPTDWLKKIREMLKRSKANLCMRFEHPIPRGHEPLPTQDSPTAGLRRMRCTWLWPLALEIWYSRRPLGALHTQDAS